MNKLSGSIGTLQGMMLIISSAGIVNHVIIIPLILQASGRDSWIAVLLAGIPLIFWASLLYLIMKRTRQEHLFLWFKRQIGTVVAWFLFLLIAFELFFLSLLTLRELSYWANITYLPKTPNLVIVIAFALVSFYSAQSGLRSIAIINGILLPFVVLLGFFVMTSFWEPG